MTSATQQVNTAFTEARGYAKTTLAQAASFVAKLNGTVFTPPTFGASWEAVAAPTIPAMPTAPTMPSVEFNAPDAPTGITETVPAITIDQFDEPSPQIHFPAPPTVSIGVAPSIPSIGAVAIPSAPVVAATPAPNYLQISTHTLGAINLHKEYLDNLSTVPTLELLEPTAFSYTRGPKYASQLLSDLMERIKARINGGTGLPPEVENAIWARGRSREMRTALANEQEALRSAETFGFMLPNGAIQSRARAAQQDFVDKMSSLSRDVMIKQAELEQENLKQSIGEGIELEKTLISTSLELERLGFDIAKATADNALQVYNAQVEKFKSVLAAFQTYASAYDTIIKGELAQIEIFKALLQGEQTKAEVNRTLVEQYKAAIEAGMSQVELYKAQIGGAQALIGLEEAKLGAAGKQIEAYVAQINGETAKSELYKTQINAEQTKASIYQTKAQAFTARVGAQAEESRAQIARFQAIGQAKSIEWQGYQAKAEVERSRINAIATQSGALLDGYRAQTAAIQVQGTMQAEMFKAKIHEYEASQNYVLQVAKANYDGIIATNASRMDAAKVGAQVYSQLAASSISAIHASASISGGDSYGISYSYSGTAPTIPPIIS